MSNITDRDPYFKPWNRNSSSNIHGLSTDFWATLSKWNECGPETLRFLLGYLGAEKEILATASKKKKMAFRFKYQDRIAWARLCCGDNENYPLLIIKDDTLTSIYECLNEPRKKGTHVRLRNYAFLENNTFISRCFNHDSFNASFNKAGYCLEIAILKSEESENDCFLKNEREILNAISALRLPFNINLIFSIFQQKAGCDIDGKTLTIEITDEEIDKSLNKYPREFAEIRMSHGVLEYYRFQKTFWAGKSLTLTACLDNGSYTISIEKAGFSPEESAEIEELVSTCFKNQLKPLIKSLAPKQY